MSIDFQMLAVISVLTTLSTEAVKSLCKTMKWDYVSNIIAAIIAVIISFVLMVIEPVCVHWADITPELIYNAVIMSFFAVLCSTLGFDKVVQTIDKLKG